MDILDEVQTHVSEEPVSAINLTANEDGDLVQAPWAGGQDIGDMTVDQLQEHLETTTSTPVDVAEAIAHMQDPVHPMSKQLMQQMMQQSGSKPRRPKMSPKKKKAKKGIAKASRRKNRK